MSFTGQSWRPLAKGGFGHKARWRDRTRNPSRPGVRNAVLSGITRDATAAPLGLCTVDMFKTLTDEKVATTTSDVSGNFSFNIAPVSGPFYLVAYLVGSPDVAGTTVNTLVTS